MPRVPGIERADRQAASPIQDNPPSPTNILMAAAVMHQLGRLTAPNEPGPQSVSTKPSRRVGRKL